jgi:hypothetical protein
MFPICTHTLCLVASALQDLGTGRVLPAVLVSWVDVNPHDRQLPCILLERLTAFPRESMHRVAFVELFLGQESRRSNCFGEVSKRYECCGVAKERH